MMGRRKDEWGEEYRYWQALKKAKEDKRSITERILSEKIEQNITINEPPKEEAKESKVVKIEVSEPRVIRHKNYREIIAERMAVRNKVEKLPGRSEKKEEIEKIDVEL